MIHDREQRGRRNMMEIIERNVIENCETGKRTETNVLGKSRGTMRNKKHDVHYKE